ncbi:hypothetical protein FQA47_005952 [Oryzias melastigma]|uniref:Uncharacterized protein n=1 Tax=Oryzias melastigma TaxID=30732 RepID=A0A834F7B8_ORYME|nr:hypothetical protein FQA47_005952 [Oryzias melastigma]
MMQTPASMSAPQVKVISRQKTHKCIVMDGIHKLALLLPARLQTTFPMDPWTELLTATFSSYQSAICPHPAASSPAHTLQLRTERSSLQSVQSVHDSRPVCSSSLSLIHFSRRRHCIKAVLRPEPFPSLSFSEGQLKLNEVFQPLVLEVGGASVFGLQVFWVSPYLVVFQGLVE